MAMSQPTHSAQAPRIHSLYQAGEEKPKRVQVIERLVDAAGSHEQAQTQLAYVQAVETYRLRMVVTVIAVLVGISFAAGVVGALLVLAA